MVETEKRDNLILELGDLSNNSYITHKDYDGFCVQNPNSSYIASS